MAMERTLVLLKPEVIQRGLVAEILGRFERRGLPIIGLKLFQPTRKQMETLYAEHYGKSFYENYIAHMVSAPCIALVIECEDAVGLVGQMVGKTQPLEAAPGTIRGDLAAGSTRTVVHRTSGSPWAAQEIAIFFNDDELISVAKDPWVFG